MPQALPRRLIIRERRPLRPVLVSLLCLTLLGTTGVLVSREFLLFADTSQADAESIPRSVQLRLREQMRQNAELKAQIAVLSRKQQVEEQAYRTVDAHLKDLQDEILALKQEISFYRGVIAGERGRGFQIQSFSVSPDGTDRGYRYRLVLTRDSKGDSVSEGVAVISVEGERGGESVRLPLSELAGRPASGLEFRFRYYQKLDGRITLPEAFVPRSVNVEVTGAKGGTPAGSKRTFEWPGKTG